MKSLQERTWGYVNSTFPLRQVYIRMNGRVQFFTFSPVLQAVCAGASLLVLGWVAFTSVNVIFNDRSIALKDRHFEQMQASYENRIAELQLSYDELNGALVVAEDRFKEAADTLDAKQRNIAQLLGHKENLRASLIVGPALKQSAMNSNALPAPALGTAAGMGGEYSLYIEAPSSVASYVPPYAPRASTTISAGAASKAPANMLPSGEENHSEGAVKQFGALFSTARLGGNLYNSSLQQIEMDQARLAELDAAEPALLADINETLTKETARLTRALRTTGINPKTLMDRVTGERGATGGPLIQLGPPSTGISDLSFNSELRKALNSLQELSKLVTALNTIPLAEPLNGSEISSGFGTRIDPFNKDLAFHAGLDFNGRTGTDVFITAPGVVVFAARNGTYGNTVEVDHGYGISTRYGHLSKILASVGTQLERGAVIGTLGSTGRSTGPHVHYEVWYDKVVRDPRKFMKAGRDVLQE